MKIWNSTVGRYVDVDSDVNISVWDANTQSYVNKSYNSLVKEEQSRLAAIAAEEERVRKIQQYYKDKRENKSWISKRLGDVWSGWTGFVDAMSDAGEALFVDLPTYAVSYGADLLGADKAAHNLKEFAQRNIYDDYYKKVTGETAQETMDDYGTWVKSDNIAGQVAQAVGGMMPYLVTGNVYGATAGFATLAGTVVPQSLNEAYSEGANDAEAFVYALSNVAVEYVTEKLFAGIPGTKSAGWADNLMAKALKKADLDDIGTSFLKELAILGYKMVGEGTEEGIAEILNPILKNVIYNAGDEATVKDVFNSFLVGALTGGVLEAPNTVIRGVQTAQAKANNGVTEKSNIADKMNMDSWEQEFDKLIGDENVTVEELRQFQKDLKDSKTELRKVTDVDMERVYNLQQRISEEIMKKTSDPHTEIETINEELDNIEVTTVEDIEEVQQLEKQKEELIKEADKGKTIPVEANRETVRQNKQKNFEEANLYITKLNEKLLLANLPVVKLAENKNINENNKRIVDMAEAFGVQVIFIEGNDSFNGTFLPGEDVVFINTSDKTVSTAVVREDGIPVELNVSKQFAFTIGHEIFHHMKYNNNKLANDFMKYLDDTLDQSQINEYIEYRYGHDQAIVEQKRNNRAEVVEEIAADEFGKMFTDKKLFEKIVAYDSVKNTSLAKKIVAYINKVLDALTHTKFRSVLTNDQIKTVRNMFENIVKDVETKYAKQQGEEAGKHTPTPLLADNQPYLGKKAEKERRAELKEQEKTKPVVKEEKKTEEKKTEEKTLVKKEEPTTEVKKEVKPKKETKPKKEIAKKEPKRKKEVVEDIDDEIDPDIAKNLEKLKSEKELPKKQIKATTVSKEDADTIKKQADIAVAESVDRMNKDMKVSKLDETKLLEIQRKSFEDIDNSVKKFPDKDRSTYISSVVDRYKKYLEKGGKPVKAMEKYTKDVKFDVGKTELPIHKYEREHDVEFNYNEEYAMTQWSGFASYVINSELRNGNALEDSDTGANYKQISDGLSSALQKLPNYEGNVKRSIDLDGQALEKFLDEHTVGNVVTYPAFTSTGVDQIYDDTMNIQLEIISHTGKETTELFRPDEREVLFDKNSSFRVLYVDHSDLSNVKIKLEDITNQHSINSYEEVTDYVTGYEDVPDSLLGFSKNGENKGYYEQQYKHSYDFLISVDGGKTFFDDSIKGLNRKQAIERARRNFDKGTILKIKVNSDVKFDTATSKFATNTVEKTPTLKFYANASDHFSTQYETQSHEQTKQKAIDKYLSSEIGMAELKNAAHRVDKGEQVFTADQKVAIVEMLAYNKTLPENQRMSPDDLTMWVDTLIKSDTEAGRAVESNKYLKYLDGKSYALSVENGLIREAYRQTNLDKNITLEDWRNSIEASNNFRLTAAEFSYIEDMFDRAMEYEEGSPQRNKRLALIDNVINAKLPAKWGQKANAFRRVAMLTSPKTLGKNTLSQAMMYALEKITRPLGVVGDKLAKTLFKSNVKSVSLRQNTLKTVVADMDNKINEFKKTMDSLKGEELRKAEIELDRMQTERNNMNTRYKDSLDALIEAYNLDIENINSAGYESHQSPQMFKNPIVKYAEKLVYGVLESSDMFFYNEAYNWHIANSVEAYNMNVSDKKKITKPTEQMRLAAVDYALETTFKSKDGLLYKILHGVRDTLNLFKVGGEGAGDILIPYFRTPVNLARTMIKYSPAGYAYTVAEGRRLKKLLNNAKATVYEKQAAQQKFAQSFAKASAGSLLMILATALAKAGSLTGDEPEDERVADLMKANGWRPYSLKIGNKYISYDWADPVSALLKTSTKLAEPSKEDENVLLEAFKYGSSQLSEMATLETYRTLLGASAYGESTFVDGMLDTVASLPASFVPNVFKDIANVIDNNKKVTWDNDPMSRVYQQTAAKIPFLKSTLETKVDTLGNEQEYKFSDIFLPGSVSTYAPNTVANEVLRVYNMTGDSSVLASDIESKITYTDSTGNARKVTLTSKEQNKVQELFGDEYVRLLDDLMRSDLYYNADPIVKAKLMSSVKDYARINAYINSGYFKDYTYKDSSTYGQIKKYTDAGLSLSNAIIYDGAISPIVADKDVHGNNIKGTENGKKAYNIMNLNISDNEKNVMLQLISPTSKTPETVDSLSALIDLDDYCNYYAVDKSDYMIQNNFSRADYQTAKAIGMDGTTFVQISNDLANIRSDYNANGEAINGSKKAKVIQYLNNSGLSELEIYYMYAQLGYSIKNYSSRIQTLINQLNLSAADKKAIYAMFFS